MEKLRSEISNDFFWDLGSMFKSDEAFEVALKEVQKEISLFEKSDLTNIDNLYEVLINEENISMQLDNLVCYSNMKLHEDGNVSKYQSYANKVSLACVDFGTKSAFIGAEIPLFSENYAKEILSSEKFKKYSFTISNLLRFKKHTLSKEVEEVLASSKNISSASDDAYAMLTDTDAIFGKIKGDNGEDIQVTEGNYIKLLQSQNRNVRKDAYETYYKFYKEHKNTMATMYYNRVKTDIFYSKTKNYNSSLEAELFGLNIDKSVYTNLIETVHSYLPVFHKYLKKRKEMLGVESLKFYDMYVPLVKEADKEVSYELAKKEVLNSVKLLGDDYVKNTETCYNEKWIDVYENKGKRGGAYSWGSYIGHPYILLNYTDTLGDMFTLSHELGHAMHSYYSKTNQDYYSSSYTIFIAEIASTFNESILMDYLLGKTTDKSEEKYLVNYFLEQFRGTLFRQTMFAEFELKAHELAEQGEVLTTETLRDLYAELLELYFCGEVEVDDFIKYEWSRIPHFYNSFYVYQYATGFSAALAFNKLIKENGATAIDKYKNLLKSGGKDYSLDLLKEAGVDMTKPEPIALALDVFKELVEKF
ncbi:MAG: oligoendopeptidase F [Lachnospirales bacterium]